MRLLSDPKWKGYQKLCENFSRSCAGRPVVACGVCSHGLGKNNLARSCFESYFVFPGMLFKICKIAQLLEELKAPIHSVDEMFKTFKDGLINVA